MVKKNIRKTVLASDNPSDFKRSDTQLDNLTVVLVLVAVCFVLCIGPVAIWATITFYVGGVKPCSALDYAGAVVELLVALNSSVNFLIYHTKIPAFRKAVRSILCKGEGYETSSASSRVTEVSQTQSSHM